MSTPCRYIKGVGVQIHSFFITALRASFMFKIRSPYSQRRTLVAIEYGAEWGTDGFFLGGGVSWFIGNRSQDRLATKWSAIITVLRFSCEVAGGGDLQSYKNPKIKFVPKYLEYSERKIS